MFNRCHRKTLRKAALDKALIELVELSPLGLRVRTDGRNIAEELGRNIHGLLGTPIANNQSTLKSMGLEGVPLDEVRGRLDAFEIALTGVGVRRCVEISLTVERALTGPTLNRTVDTAAQTDEPPTYSYVLTPEQSTALGYIPM